MKITESVLKSLKVDKEAKSFYIDSDIYVRVHPHRVNKDGIFVEGKKKFYVRLRHGEKRTSRLLGNYPHMSVKEAKDFGRLQLTAFKSGRLVVKSKRGAGDFDRHFVKNYAEKGLTVEEAFLRVIERCETSCSQKTNRERLSKLELHVFPVFGTWKLDEVKAVHLEKFLRQLQDEKGLTETARKVLQIIQRLYQHCQALELCDTNPAALVDRSVALRRHTVEHRPAVSFNEAPKLIEDVRAANGAEIVKLCVEFTAFSGLRSTASRNLRWSWLDCADIDEATRITIPAAIMKSRREHVVPISSGLRHVLKRIKATSFGDERLFVLVPSSKNVLSSGTVSNLLKRAGYHGRHCLHGFRSVFSSFAHEVGFNTGAIREQLAHAHKNAVDAAYDRSAHRDARDVLLEAYSQLLNGQLTRRGGIYYGSELPEEISAFAPRLRLGC